MARARVRPADLILGLGICLAGVVVAFVLYHAQRLLTDPGRTGFFLGLPAVGLFALVAALRLPAPAKNLAATLLIAIGAAVYGFEAFKSFVGGPPPLPVPEGAAFDTRTRFRVVTDMRAEGGRAYPAVFPAYLMQTDLDGALHSPIVVDGVEVLPLGGVAATPTVLCNESGEHVIYESDERGFNNPPGIWRQESVAVAAVGDSHVQGYCVPPEKNFVALIGRDRPPTLNLGMSGSGPLIALATLKEFLPSLRPPVVLWFFFEGNDIPGDLSVERRSLLLLRYLEEPDFRQGLAGKHAALDRALAEHIDRLLAAQLDGRGTDAGLLQAVISFVGLAETRRALKLPSVIGAPDYPFLERIMAEAKRTVESWGGRLFMVYLPGFQAVAGPGGATADPRHRPVQAIAEGLELPFVDLWAVIAEHPDAASLYPFRRSNHFNEKGHALVARTVSRAIAGTGH